MSRAGAKPKEEMVVVNDIPMPPQVVQNVQRAMLERKRAMIFASCRHAAWKGQFPLWRSPEALGERLADIMLYQIQQQMIARQSKIVAPKTGLAVARS